MTYTVSGGTLNPTHSLTETENSLALGLGLAFRRSSNRLSQMSCTVARFLNCYCYYYDDSLCFASLLFQLVQNYCILDLSTNVLEFLVFLGHQDHCVW